MMKNKWVVIVVVAAIIVGGLWYTGMLQTWMPGATEESAASANATKVTTTATNIQKTIADITAAMATKDARVMESLKPEYTATVASITALAPQLKKSIDTAMGKGKDMIVANGALVDLNTKLSFLQTSTLSLQNAQIDITNLNAIYGDISTIKTALQK